ncbi:hypothetical protein BHE74_00022820 [Ensete ventricosum]|nr:hypothetical protein BHE74_00022820 [Ensete ventricosum]
MGCYPVGKMVSKVLRMCKGWKRQGVATTMADSPPPAYSYAGTKAKHVTFCSGSSPVEAVPPEPPFSKHNPEAVISPSPQAEMVQLKEQIPVRLAPEPDRSDESRISPNYPDASPDPTQKSSVRVRFDPGPNTRPNQNEPVPAHPGSASRYITSPLPRWEEGERRREYFGGEYHYYPTPIREGIYSIATDENRLTAILSEENPNACSIV